MPTLSFWHACEVHDRAKEAIESWDRWVTELEDHPLDPFEYEAMLASRDALAVELEIAGVPSLWALADEMDVRFRDVTTTGANPVTGPPTSPGWWWGRVPADPDALGYLRGER